MQTCPEFANAETTQRGTATPRSVSGSTTVPELFPSSIVTFLRPAARTMPSPTDGDPVKDTFDTRRSVTSQSPTVDPGPTSSSSTPSGRPASRRTSHSSTAVRGVVDAGFSTTEFPAARAGPTLWATRFKGKLKGVMAATTPTGTRTQKPQRPSPAALASMGTVSPWTRFASSAEKRKVSTLRSASARACFQALPASRAMVVAISSRRASSRSAAR